jgi:Protein of unknown function (DUF3485)
MKSNYLTTWAPLLLGLVALIGVTVAQGKITGRWSGKNVSEELREDAARLESSFPKEFGSWKMVGETEADPAQLKVAGAVGHISREYQNVDSGARVGVFVVCATPSDASGHTPDRCYPSAGFEIAEQEHRENIPLPDGATAEAFSGSFKKQGESLRIFWTYAVTGKWVAPQIARIELANSPVVFKIYAIIDETAMPRGEGSRTGLQFLADLIPEFDRAIFVAKDEAQGRADGGAPTSVGSNGA